MTRQSEPRKTGKGSSRKGKFVQDKYLSGYTKPKMVEAAKEMLCNEEISEEGFLGAQAVLFLNGFL